MSPAKPKAATSALTINDDGSASCNVQLNDTDGVPITTLTTWPTAVAQPTVTGADNGANFTVTPVTPPTPATDASATAGSFVVATIASVQPPVQPLASNVDFQVSIASGLTGQTAPVTADAGTLSLQADASSPGGVSASLGTP